MNRLLKMNTHNGGALSAYFDSTDSRLPIEIAVGCDQAWLTPKQVLDLSEFLVLAIEQLNKEKTNGSELQET